MFQPPDSPEELLRRARALTGLTLGEIARILEAPMPEDPRRAKGWIGNLIETALGAASGNLPQPDFDEIGVELKTIPVDAAGSPKASTFVCTASRRLGERWETSRVRHKLARVLWVPIVVADTLGERRVGVPVDWRPSEEAEAALRADWELLSELLGSGESTRLDGRLGACLQLRPKGADAGASSWAQDAEGEWTRADAVGFYLRPAFTRAILAR